MRYVYTKPAGLEVRVDIYGTASNTTPAEVPDEVGDELAADERFRVETGRDTLAILHAGEMFLPPATAALLRKAQADGVQPSEPHDENPVAPAGDGHEEKE